jgi:hypothetical protein
MPNPFQLSTVYTAAVAAGSRSIEAARKLVGLLTESATASVRQRLGFLM